jgi:transcriptional regulator GlxA family with amidase domain
MDRIQYSISAINAAKGAVSIKELCSWACLGRRQFERMFTGYVGAAPKQFLKTVRFQNSLRIKQSNLAMNLTELAHSSGYYDQPHMIRDYRLLAGITPSEYFNQCEPYSDYFQQ